MKTILCYGDSNTWGYDASTQGRFARELRWPKVLQAELGEGYEVIAEGLNGRTTVWPDPVEGEYKSGKTYLTACLESHHPIDVVVILLGTNDLKHRFGQSAADIARGAATLAGIVMTSAFGPGGDAPQVLLIAPPPTVVGDGPFADMFAGADEKSSDLGKHYGLLASELGCAFLDAGQVIVSTKLDGIHLDAGEQVKLGKAVAVEARRLLNVGTFAR
jgi:lysophospholipase L1-like esterase